MTQRRSLKALREDLWVWRGPGGVTASSTQISDTSADVRWLVRSLSFTSNWSKKNCVPHGWVRGGALSSPDVPQVCMQEVMKQEVPSSWNFTVASRCGQVFKNVGSLLPSHVCCLLCSVIINTQNHRLPIGLKCKILKWHSVSTYCCRLPWYLYMYSYTLYALLYLDIRTLYLVGANINTL